MKEDFSESLVSKELCEFFDRKFPKSVTPIALCKCLATVSCKLERPRFSALHVAPPRHFKSYSSNEVRKIFGKEFWINLRSDFTMHSLQRYKEKLKEGKCLHENDVTTLLASKLKRSKERLVGGLSELLADEVYTYQDFQKKFTLEGKVTLVMNMTSEAYKNYKERLFGITFSERVLSLHHVLMQSEMDAWVVKEEKSANIHFKGKIRLCDIETDIKEIPRTYLSEIQQRAREFSFLSLRGFVGSQDLVKGLVRAHAALNRRREVCDDDFMLLSMIKPYLINPFSPYEGRIVKYAAQGLSYREICKHIGKPESYVRQVYAVVERARIRGIIPLEYEPHRHILRENSSAPRWKINGEGGG